MTISFQPATKQQAKARIAVTGPAGAGKTFTALSLARVLGKRIALIDTEHGSASKYADEFSFDALSLSNFHPDNYIEAIGTAGALHYDVVVIDSASHEWSGPGGCLELVDNAARRIQGNSFAAWKDVTPLHNRFIEAIHKAPLHVIATFRSKMEYAQGTDASGRKKVDKLGLAPITRDGAEYEFDIVLDLDLEHVGLITKSRARVLADTQWRKPGQELGEKIRAWLSDGSAPSPEKIAATREPDIQGARTQDATPSASETSNAPLAPAPPIDGHGAGGPARGSTASPPPRTPSQIAAEARKHVRSPQADYAPEDAVCGACGRKEALRPLGNPRFCAKADGGCGAPARGAEWQLISYGEWKQRQARPVSEKLNEAVERARR